MEKQDFISTSEICTHYHVELSFIRELREHDLIEINTLEKTEFISADRLSELERFIRLHYDLDINLEGLEAVNHLLKQIEDMQDQMRQLQNRLHLYED